MDNMSDALKRRIEEVLDDIETVEDFLISDTDDPDVVDITIRGRLSEDAYNIKDNKQQDPDSDYDRAMKGLSPWHDTHSHNTSSNN